MNDDERPERLGEEVLEDHIRHPNKAAIQRSNNTTNIHASPPVHPTLSIHRQPVPEPCPRNSQCPCRQPLQNKGQQKKNQQSNLTPPSAPISFPPCRSPSPLRWQSADVFNPVRPPVFHHHQTKPKNHPTSPAVQTAICSASNHDREQQRRGTTTTMEIAVSGRED